MIRAFDSASRITTKLNAARGFEELQNDSINLVPGVEWPKNRWIFDWSERESKNAVKASLSSGRVFLTVAVEPSRRIKRPESGASW